MDDEEEEDVVENNISSAAEGQRHLPSDEELEPDIEDHAATKLQRIEVDAAESTVTRKLKHEVWVSIDGGDISEAAQNSVKHKATILRLYSNPMSVQNSLDRLKQVRGYSRYNNISTAIINTDPTYGKPCISIDDPIVTLLRCETRVYLAIAQIKDIVLNGSHCDSIQYSDIDAAAMQRMFNSAKFKIQVLKIVQRASLPGSTNDSTHKASTDLEDWEWNGSYKGGSATPLMIEINGKYVEATQRLDNLLALQQLSLQHICSKHWSCFP